MSAWSPTIGVGGLTAQLVLGDAMDTAGAVQRWTRTVFVASAAGPDAFARHCAAFPYGAVVGQIRQVGKTEMPPSILVALEQAQRALRQCAGVIGVGLDVGSPGDVLDRWLPLTLDLHHGTVSYDTYIGNPLLETVGDSDSAVDELVAALVADLTEHEASRQLHTAEPGQNRRTRAALQALRRVRTISPRATNALVAEVDRHEHDVATAATALAARVLDATSRPIVQLVTLTMLPMTALHDELMFVRSVQILDRLFAIVAAAVRAAGKSVAERDAEEGAALLNAAAIRIESTAPLFRVLATMPAEAFAVIRTTTAGSSAIQSRSFRDFESTAAGLDPAPLSAPDRERVAASMVRLQRAWRTLKRTHWGIAVKLIGSAVGTGGTSGAQYLRTRMDQPLFPLLLRSEW